MSCFASDVVFDVHAKDALCVPARRSSFPWGIAPLCAPVSTMVALVWEVFRLVLVSLIPVLALVGSFGRVLAFPFGFPFAFAIRASDGAHFPPIAIVRPVCGVRYLVATHWIRHMPHVLKVTPNGRLDFRTCVIPIGIEHHMLVQFGRACVHHDRPLRIVIQGLAATVFVRPAYQLVPLYNEE